MVSTPSCHLQIADKLTVLEEIILHCQLLVSGAIVLTANSPKLVSPILLLVCYYNDKLNCFFSLSSDAKLGHPPTLKSTLIQNHFLNCFQLWAKGTRETWDCINNPSCVYRSAFSWNEAEIKQKEDLLYLGQEKEKKQDNHKYYSF